MLATLALFIGLDIVTAYIVEPLVICKRIRARLPDTQILVIRPGIQANGQESAQKLTEEGASGVAFTLQEAHSKAEQLLSMSQTNPLRSSPA